MTIRYMFNSIKDPNLLYESKEKTVENPFGETETTITVTSKSKEYSNTLMNRVKDCIQGLTYQYKGCFGRIAREVFDVRIGNSSFEVVFVVDTSEEKKSSITVEISCEETKESDFEKRYIKDIEQFKLTLKTQMIKEHETCIWLADDQSEMLCGDLYRRFFRIENQVRAFANKVMIRHLGHKWLEKPGLEKYSESVKNLVSSFKQIVPDFANIDTTLLSMTLETLAEIILKSTIYKEQTVLTSLDVMKVFQHLNKHNDDAAKETIQRKRETSVNIWDDIFVQYFDKPDEFKSQLTQFIKSRNHIAHNKLLTFSVFKQMHTELDDFETTISKAMTSFDNQNASEELLDTLQAEHEQDEYEEQYWRDRITGETGVEIRNDSEIFELFCQTIDKLCEDISDKYHYDPCFSVANGDDPTDNKDTLVFLVTSNASEEKLQLQVSISIDDDMDETSFLQLEAIHDGEVIATAVCTYHNGAGHEGGEGVCVADSDSEYDETQMHNFFEDVCEYIENSLNPYIAEMEALAYEAVKDGGASPVADFACQECGRYGVSILKDFLPIGKCCYCGTENEVYICEICGTVFDDMGGKGNICNGCLPNDND